MTSILHDALRITEMACSRLMRNLLCYNRVFQN